MTDYHLKYNRLEARVRAYLQAQEEYFKSKEHDKFKKMMALRKEVVEFMAPKKEKTLFDLAQ